MILALVYCASGAHAQSPPPRQPEPPPPATPAPGTPPYTPPPDPTPNKPKPPKEKRKRVPTEPRSTPEALHDDDQRPVDK